MKVFLENFKRNLLSMALPSVITGMVAGIVISFFKISADFIVNISGKFYTFASTTVWHGAVCLCVVIALSLCAFFIAKKFPFSKGGGIPFSFTISQTNLKFGVIGTFFATFLSSLITFFVGVPLGVEGPSVQLGALLGCQFSKSDNKKELTTVSAGAGFCAATGSALGGFLFSFEEMKGKINAKQVVSAFLCTAFSYLSSFFLCRAFGVHFSLFEKLKFTESPKLLIFLPLTAGVLCGGAAVFFTKLATTTRKLFNTFKAPKPLPLLVVFAAVFVTALFVDNAAGSGLDLIKSLSSQNLVLSIVMLLLVLRTLFLVVSNAIGITGGLFVPLLTLGALTGALCFLIANHLFSLPIGSEVYFIVLFAGAFISATNKMPLTVTAFLCETFCGFGALLPVLAATLISFGLFNLFCKKDLTEEVFEELKEKNCKCSS